MHFYAQGQGVEDGVLGLVEIVHHVPDDLVTEKLGMVRAQRQRAVDTIAVLIHPGGSQVSRPVLKIRTGQRVSQVTFVHDIELVLGSIVITSIGTGNEFRPIFTDVSPNIAAYLAGHPDARGIINQFKRTFRPLHPGLTRDTLRYNHPVVFQIIPDPVAIKLAGISDVAFGQSRWPPLLHGVHAGKEKSNTDGDQNRRFDA